MYRIRQKEGSGTTGGLERLWHPFGLVCADDVSIPDRSALTAKKHRLLVIASKETGLALHAENTKCRYVSSKQHAGQNHSTNLGNETFEMAEHFNVWEQTERIKIPFRKKLRAE